MSFPQWAASDGSGTPDPELVQTVIRACNCTELRAIALLKISNNDIARAQRHHAAFMKYAKPTKSVPSTPSNPSSGFREVGSSNLSDSGASSLYSIPADTPPTEEELPETPSHSSLFSKPPSAHRSQTGQTQDPGLAFNKLHPDPNLSTSPQTTREQENMPTHLNHPVHLGLQDSSGTTTGKSETVPIQGVEKLALNDRTIEDGPAPTGDWDFVLPEAPSPGILVPGDADEIDGFSPDALVRAIQHGATVETVRNYLESHDIRSVKEYINEEVQEVPAIFYAVGTNSENMVRLFIEFGADASAVHRSSQVPLLAFAIVNGETLQADTTTIVSILLCHGASSHVIPSDIFAPYTQDPPTHPKLRENEDVETAELTKWCTDAVRLKLAKAANITQRYYLERATKLKKPSKKRQQIAQRRNAEGLLGVPYFLVGQSVATELLIQRLLTHLMMPTKRPLVLCFAGPSGHGKTELARQLGHLLTLDLEVVDCTIVNREMELFGPREPYSGAEKGSPVNNFLAAHTGQRCIVFLDEFEKTTREIHQALLLPFDNGEYQDRRNHEKIDCSNTIWILATNALDNTILDFCQLHDALFGEDEVEKSKLSKQLSRKLQEAFLQHFDAPVTGRVSDFVPFLPFSAGEQAVITHKSLLELAEELRRPICLSNGADERLVGDIRLVIKRDATVCKMLAEEHYNRKLGARSLKKGAEKVQSIVVVAYLDEEEELQESAGLCDFIIDVQGGQIVGRVGKRNK